MNDLLDLIVFSPDADQRARRSGALAEMGFRRRFPALQIPTPRRPDAPPRCQAWIRTASPGHCFSPTSRAETLPWCADAADAATPPRSQRPPAPPPDAGSSRTRRLDPGQPARRLPLTQAEREFLLKLTSAMDKRLPRSRLRARPPGRP